MTVSFKKVKRVFVDVNCFVSILINRDTERFVRYISQNNLEVFYDKLLMEEMKRVLNYPKIKSILTLKTELYLSILELIGTKIVSKPYEFQCPDENDGYLYNIALSANAKLLVTGDKALLNWQNPPIDTISLAQFMDLY